MTGAEYLADFAMRSDPVPEAVRAAARLHALDALGVGYAAAAGTEQKGWARVMGTGGPATLLTGGTASAAEAAMLNGALIHSLEYDDTHIGSVIHGSAVALPAALAAAQAAGAGGPALLEAYILAWEAMIRIGLAAPGAMQARGAQVTAVAGAIGAALAASRLHGLTRRETVAALGIAGSQASGLLAFLEDGSSVKALNPGWAAHTGVTAAALARAGMTGPGGILEHRFGPLAVFGADPDALSLDDLGSVWHLPDAAFKLYPCCHYIHPFLEAVEILMSDGLSASRVGGITVHVPVEQAPLIADPWPRRQAPVSGYDGKWGLAYCIALMLVDGAVDVTSFETAPRDAVIALARRIDHRPWQGSGFPTRFPARIEVTTTEGHRLAQDIETVLGAPERPVALARITDKFRRNTARSLPTDRTEVLITTFLDPNGPDLSLL